MKDSLELILSKEEIIDMDGNSVDKKFVVLFDSSVINPAKVKFDSKEEMLATVKSPTRFIDKLKVCVSEEHVNKLLKIGHYEIDSQKFYI